MCFKLVRHRPQQRGTFRSPFQVPTGKSGGCRMEGRFASFAVGHPHVSELAAPIHRREDRNVLAANGIATDDAGTFKKTIPLGFEHLQ